MKKYKIISIVFCVVSIVLLCVMCSVVSYSYANLVCSMNHIGGSAPPDVAFLLIIPFMFGIVITSLLSFYFYKKMKNSKSDNNLI